jgi:hypothetical protein
VSKVVVVTPSYDNRANFGSARSIFQTGSRKHDVLPIPQSSSLSIQNCNGLWCKALNLRKNGFQWFAMLHADVTPDILWIDTLIDEAEKYKADFMSVVIPIKSEEGVTSTAILDAANLWRPWCRLTTSQKNYKDFPKTFDINGLIRSLDKLPEPLGVHKFPSCPLLGANTGCMVVRLHRPWATSVWFQGGDRIAQESNGNWIAENQPEDWWFARRIAEEGGVVMSTQIVEVLHEGRKNYSSKESWGAPIDFTGEFSGYSR